MDFIILGLKCPPQVSGDTQDFRVNSGACFYMTPKQGTATQDFQDFLEIPGKINFGRKIGLESRGR